LIGVHRAWVDTQCPPLVIFGGGQHPNCLPLLALDCDKNKHNKQRRNAR
jgi:hypothetical protein